MSTIMLMTCQLALCSIFAHCCPHSTYQGTESENYISCHFFFWLEEWGGALVELRKVGNSSMLLASFCWSHICNKSCLFHAFTFYLFICGFYKNRKASLLRLHPRTVSNWSNPHLNLFSHLGYSNILLWNLCTVSRWWSGFLNTFFPPTTFLYWILPISF